MKSKEKFVDDILNLFRNENLSKNILKTPTGFILEQKDSDWMSLLFLGIYIMIPAIVLIYSDLSIGSFSIILIWVVVIGNSLYNSLVSENRVEFNLPERTVEIQNLNVLTKPFFRKEIIEFKEIQGIKIKSVSYSSLGLSSSRLVLSTKSYKSYVLNDYASDFVARKLKFALECIIANKRETNSPNKVQP